MIIESDNGVLHLENSERGIIKVFQQTTFHSNAVLGFRRVLDYAFPTFTKFKYVPHPNNIPFNPRPPGCPLSFVRSSYTKNALKYVHKGERKMN